MNKTIKKRPIIIHNKTLKKKNIYKNISTPLILNKIELKKCFYFDNKNMSLKQTYIKLLEQIADVKMKQGEHFRARAYTKARDKLMLAPDFKTAEDIKALKLGASVIKKLKEFNNTGKVKFLEDAKNDPCILFTDIYGVGPKKAVELVKTHNIKSIEELRKNKDELLNDVQKIGLKYYEDILKRIPRDEIIQYETKLKRLFNEVKTDGSIMNIVGSYRRGATNSGDIDIIICDPSNNVKLFHNFLDKLIENDIIIEVLSRGDVKSLCISKIRGKPARRIDFMFTPRSEYSYAMLYFTGNKEFNTVMRSRALKLGYSMNEHGMYKMVNGTKTTKLNTFMPEEKDIFNFLGMEYKEPQDRTGSNAVILKKRTVPKLKGKKIDILQLFLKNGPNVLSEQQVNHLLIMADKAYYGEGDDNTPIMTDAQYDMLKEHAEENFPNCEALKNVAHTTIEVQKNKVKLPYEMWSLDKEKTVKGVTRRISKYPGDYIISAKADGISVLYDMENKKLYSRGNGTYGQDLSFMIPYLRLPEFNMGLVIRGELIIKKDTFEKKYKGQFSNPRNFVAGVANAKKMNVKMVKDLDILTYEVIRPKLKPSDQMKILSDTNIIKHVIVKDTDINTEFLSKCLLDWRENYPWEIDGVVVCQDILHKRVSGNPKHAFAFKMVLSDQIVEARVIDVIWEPSQQGYVKPKIRIKPVEIGGARIEYATGHNAAFIFNNKINVGSVIQLIRSGDVIPKVHKVIAPSEQGKAPPSNMETVWNSTKIDLVLKDKASNSIVLMKSIAAFFEKIGVVGLGRGNIQRIIDAGFDTIPKIVSMTVDDFLTVEGFKEKLSNKIYNNIRSSILNVSLEALMAGTNIFGRGLGAKKIKVILTKYPDILWSKETQEEKLKIISELPGFQAKTAAAFVPHISEFMEFIEKIGMTDKIKDMVPKKYVGDTNHILYNKKVVFTGIRDKSLQQALEKIGVIMGNSVSKNTDYVIVKSLTDDTGKAEKARDLGVPLLTPEMFKNKFTVPV